jgi:PKHD-type hydroxylase
VQYPLTPYTGKMIPYAWWDNAFTQEELNYLQDIAKKADTEASIGGAQGGGINSTVRRSEVSWMHRTEETTFVFERLAHVVSSLNAEYFNFDLDGFGEPLQLTTYSEKHKGMYGWHQDFGGEICRKLSVVLQLSDPSDYEGGNLEILKSSDPERIKKQRGLIAVFPSWTLHQVTPVVQGNRQSLVAWVSGKRFV